MNLKGLFKHKKHGLEDVEPGGVVESGTVLGDAAEFFAAEDREGDTVESGLASIKEFTRSEGVEVTRGNVSLREILGGDIFMNGWLRRQMGVIVLCVVLSIVYITNRYSAEQEIIEIEKLKTDLTEVRYRALTRSGELTVKTRQSQVEAFLKQTPDSVLVLPKEPPFIIKYKEK